MHTALHHFIRPRRYIAALALFAMMIALPGVSAADEKQVAIVPFKVNAEADLTFLRDGILSMLASRLSWENRVIAAGRDDIASELEATGGTVDEGSLRDIGKRMGVDYILFGSLTQLGQSMSIDAKMADVSGGAPVRSFFVQSPNMNSVIPQINRLAEDINVKVFGRMPETVLRSTPATEEKPSVYAHPERLMSDEAAEKPPIPTPEPQPVPEPMPEPIPVPKEDPVPDSPSVPAAPTEQKPGSTPDTFWKSGTIDMRIKGLSLGDVDGDGKIETAVISSRELVVYRLDKGRFYKILEYKGKGYQQFIAVDVADIRQNNRAEIFVTCLNATSGSLESFVLEWDGSSFLPVAGLERWYYRVQHHPKRPAMLYGQKRSRGKMFHGDVRQLAWDGQGYTPQQAIQVPKGVAIYMFAQGDLLHSGNDDIVAMDKEDRLRLYSDSGREHWKSEDRYSGSENYLERIDNPENVLYLPHRLWTTDLDGDGKAELLVVNNQGTTGRYLKRYRRYKSGLFESLSWDGLGLASTWQTRKISGYLADHAVGDIDNDGRPELVGVVVSQRGSLISKAASAVIAYNLDLLTGER